MKLKNYAIILASGSSTRFGGGEHGLKQFVKIAGQTILEHTIELFERAAEIDEIILVIPPGRRDSVEQILLRHSYTKVSRMLEGGETRKDSSRIGICSIPDEEANVVIHDCARPLLSHKIISESLAALKTHQAVDVAFPSADTIIQVNEDKYIEQIPDRSRLMRGQTPQSFRLSIIRRAHELSRDDSAFTDDCGLVLKHRLAEVYVVEGDRANIKITWPEDLFLADKLFQVRSTKELAIDEAQLTELRGQVVVIFGGSKGIGASVAERLRQLGGIPCSFSLSQGCDVANYEQVEAALRQAHDEHGRIDAVICTAGVLKLGKLEQRDIAELRRELEVNYMGSINVCKAAIPYLRSTHGSLILFASSSYTRGRALYAPYSSTKAGIVNLMQALAEELYPEHIRVNVINPARTATPMRTAAFGNEPAGSLLSPEQVAVTTLKTLLTPLTGQVVDVIISPK